MSDLSQVMQRALSQVRRFNRRITQGIGALEERYLGLDRPLAQARLLFEIGTTGAELQDLRVRLGLDSGYLSRLLRALERDGLVITPIHDADRRHRRTLLTRAGRAELRKLDRRSDALAVALLRPLDRRQRAELLQALTTIDAALAASQVTTSIVSPESEEAQYCLRAYYRELGSRFEEGFDPEKSISPTLGEFVPPSGGFIVLRRGGQPIGCGGFKRMGLRVAYLKRMWIAPEQRGLGLGRRLLTAIEGAARAAGYRVIRLEANRTLVEAQQLYRHSGYREVKPFNDEIYAHHWYEKRLRR